MGGGGSSSQPTTSTVTQTNTTQLPSWAQPYAQNLLTSGGALTSNPYSPYPYIYNSGTMPYSGGGQQYSYAAAPTTGAYVNPTAPQGETKPNIDQYGGVPTRQGTYYAGDPYGSGIYNAPAPTPTQTQTGAGTGTAATTTPGGYYTNILTGENVPYGSYLPYQSNIAPLSIEQQLGLSGITGRAISGSPLIGSAQNMIYNTLGGSYLNPATNPWLSQTFQQGAEDLSRQYFNDLMPQVQSAATRAGAFGGSQDTLMRGEVGRNYGDALSNLATGIYGGAYDKERANQMQASYFAPSLAAEDYKDMQALLGVGDVQREYQQALLNEQMQQWASQMQWPYSQLGFMGSLIPAAVGGTGSSTSSGTQSQPSQYTANPTGQILGTAASGIGTLLGIASMFGWLSDKRTKENIQPLDTDALRILKQLNPVVFDYRPQFGNPGQIGFVADEVQALAGGMVFEGDDGYKRLMPMALITLLVKAVQELQSHIETLEHR